MAEGGEDIPMSERTDQELYDLMYDKDKESVIESYDDSELDRLGEFAKELSRRGTGHDRSGKWRASNLRSEILNEKFRRRGDRGGDNVDADLERIQTERDEAIAMSQSIQGKDSEDPTAGSEYDKRKKEEYKRKVNDSNNVPVNKEFRAMFLHEYKTPLPESFFVRDTFLEKTYHLSKGGHIDKNGDLSRNDIVYYKYGGRSFKKGFNTNSISGKDFKYQVDSLNEKMTNGKYVPSGDPWGYRNSPRRDNDEEGEEETNVDGETTPLIPPGGSASVPDRDIGAEVDGLRERMRGRDNHGQDTGLGGSFGMRSSGEQNEPDQVQMEDLRRGVNERAEDINQECNDIQQIIDGWAGDMGLVIRPGVNADRPMANIDGLTDEENALVAGLVSPEPLKASAEMGVEDNLARFRIVEANRELNYLQLRATRAYEVTSYGGRDNVRIKGLDKAIYRVKGGLNAATDKIANYERKERASQGQIARSKDALRDNGDISRRIESMRTRVRLLEGRVNDLTRLEKLRSWMKKNGVALAGVTVTIGAIVAAIVAATRSVGVNTSVTLGKWANALKKFADKAWPWLAPIFSALATIVKWGAKGVSWLADNLWMVAILVVVALFNWVYEKSARRRRRRRRG